MVRYFCARHSSVLTCHPRFFANRVLLSPPSHSTPEDAKVEWAYAFDVHTNAFFPLYLTLYLAQLFLVPIVLKNNWICLFVSNTLYLAGYVHHGQCTFLVADAYALRFAQYIYGIYLGLNSEETCPRFGRVWLTIALQLCRSLSEPSCY